MNCNKNNYDKKDLIKNDYIKYINSYKHLYI